MPARFRLHAAPATLVSLAVILALVGVALMALSGAEAAGQQQPQCGDTITADTTLDKNLVDCPNFGIVIGADNITLDLNGHLIDGLGPLESPDGVVIGGYDGVTVKHGRVRGFDVGVSAGIALARKNVARHTRLLGVSSTRNIDGMQLHIVRSLVRNSSVAGNIHRGTGMLLFRSDHVRLLHNSFRHNSMTGMSVFESTNNLIEENRFSRNRFRDGIAMNGGSRNVLKRNIAKENGEDGFDIEERTAKLTGNRAVRNHDLGIEAVRGVINGGGNEASGNGDPRQCTNIVCN